MFSWTGTRSYPMNRRRRPIEAAKLTEVLYETRDFRFADSGRQARRGQTASRTGFTLVELACRDYDHRHLIGMMLPAVQACAEAARRACLNNLTQIGVALQNYESAQGVAAARQDRQTRPDPQHARRLSDELARAIAAVH